MARREVGKFRRVELNGWDRAHCQIPHSISALEDSRNPPGGMPEWAGHFYWKLVLKLARASRQSLLLRLRERRKICLDLYVLGCT